MSGNEAKSWEARRLRSSFATFLFFVAEKKQRESGIWTDTRYRFFNHLLTANFTTVAYVHTFRVPVHIEPFLFSCSSILYFVLLQPAHRNVKLKSNSQNLIESINPDLCCWKCFLFSEAKPQICPQCTLSSTLHSHLLEDAVDDREILHSFVTYTATE